MTGKYGKQGIAALFFGLWMLVLCLSAGGADEEPRALLVQVESTGRIGIYGNLYSLTEDSPMAILFEIKIPQGTSLDRIVAGEGAEGLVLTHGDVASERVRVLLDGVCKGRDGEAILWLYTKKTSENPHDRGGYMGVTGPNGDNLMLYVLDNGGQVREIPLEVVWDIPAEETTEIRTDPSPAETFWETVEETIQEPIPETETAIPSEEFPRVAKLLGCRETGVADGVYTVQFLFGGEGGTPVVCMAGGGLLYVESGSMDGVYGGRGRDVKAFCTVRGLLAGRTYQFWVGSETGWISVTYEDGRFCGFG